MHKKDTLSVDVSLRLIQYVNKRVSPSFFRVDVRKWSELREQMTRKTTIVTKQEPRNLSKGTHLSDQTSPWQAKEKISFFVHFLLDWCTSKGQLGWLSLITCAHARMSTARLLYKRREIYRISSFSEGRHRDDLSSSINTRIDSATLTKNGSIKIST